MTGDTPDWIEYARKRAALINRTRGNLTGYDCPKCLNRGYTMVVKDDGCSVLVDCECMKRRRSERMMARSGLGDALESAKFSTWVSDTPWRKKLSEKAVAYGKAVKENFIPDWFLAFGPPGTGKSHICTALAGGLIRSCVEVRYMLWRDVATAAKAAINDMDEYQSIVFPLKTVPVLYIDDLFKIGKGVAPTSGDVNLAFEILNSRYVARLPTIISTERSIQELLDIDEAVGSRIYERSKSYMADLTGKENWRLR